MQTITPTVTLLNSTRPSSAPPLKIRVENGLGEFYGLARFDHPSPAPLDTLHTHFEDLDGAYQLVIRPSVNGESVECLHDRIAYALHHVIKKLDSDPDGPRALLICTHAASMIAIGRVLTGRMPEDHGEEDFKCFTCSLSRFERKQKKADAEEEPEPPTWDSQSPDDVPDVRWRGKGVQGGWECKINGDCSFLENGEERGW